MSHRNNAAKAVLLSALLGVGVLLSAGSACDPQSLIAIMPGVVNDPANRTLRRELLAFGTGSLCKELMKRSIPLKLRDEDPSIGRFFPRQCKLEPLQNGDLYIQFSGVGYAWSNLTKRVGFTASAAVQYEQDFRLDGSTMYIYFKPATTTAKKFELGLVEQQALPQTPVTPLFPGGNAQGFMSQIGEGLMAREIGRGFTVIRESDGSAAFGVGLLPVGERPAAPYERRTDERLLYVNENIEIHQEQRDFVGPIELVDDDMAIYVTMSVTGAPAVDVLLYPKNVADPWLHAYLTVGPAGAAPAPPMFEETVASPTSPVPGLKLHKRLIRARKGSYYLVLDNTSSAGRHVPQAAALDDRAAMVSLAVEIGDAP
jgi:hypothetical protein